MAGRVGSSMSTRAALGFQGGVGIAGLVLIWLLEVPVAWGPLASLWTWLYGALGAAVTYGVLLLLTLIPGLFPSGLERQMQGLFDFASSYPTWVLVALSVLAGVGEELLFRGGVQGLLSQYLSSWLAIAAASLLFGLVHFVSLTYFLVATGLGLVLGLTYHLSDSLWLVMIWHALYDLLALFCLLRFPHRFGVRAH